MTDAPRSEAEIFADLEHLCGTAGYIHLLADLVFRNTFVRFADKIKSADFRGSYRRDHLIRTELSTLHGLMVKQKIDFAVPTPEQMALLRGRTIEVLEELHHSLSGSLTAPRETTTIQGPTDVDFKRGEALLLLCYKVGTSSLIGFAGEIFG